MANGKNLRGRLFDSQPLAYGVDYAYQQKTFDIITDGGRKSQKIHWFSDEACGSQMDASFVRRLQKCTRNLFQ